MGGHDHEDGRASMLVAVDERDLGFVPGARGQSFPAYWFDVHARAARALAAGERPLLAPIVDFAYVRKCNENGLEPRSAEGFHAYEAQRFRKDELWPFAGESADEMLLQMKREQQAWAMMIRCRTVFGAVNAQHPDAEAWVRAYSTRVFEALVEDVSEGAAASGAEGGKLVLAAKSADMTLGAYALAVGVSGGQSDVLDRDRERFIALLGASLITSATGVLTSMIGEDGQVQVWELGKQCLTPSEHGELILEPNDGAVRPVTYVPGFPLPLPV